MRKYYEGEPNHYFVGIHPAEHYQSISATWNGYANEERENGFIELARESQHYAAIFAAEARYKMGLQD